MTDDTRTTIPASLGIEETLRTIKTRAAAGVTTTARQDVPALVGALRAVLRPGITEAAEWLGEIRSSNTSDWGGDPGNAAYMTHIQATLTAAGYTGRWGPIFLAIILDRGVRATEDAIAVTSALSVVRP